MNDNITTKTSAKKKPEIIMIENDPVFCLIQEKKLKPVFKQPIHIFTDTREALAFITEYTDRDILVLLDINMPGMDGWEFLEELQEITRNSVVKVIMLSCSINTSDNLKSKTFPHVVDYFEKPLGPAHLKKMQEILSAY